MDRTEWRSGEVLAWSGHDGPGEPPAGPSRWITGAVAGTLAVTLTGIVASDTLCPEHRAWVQGLASLAIVSAVVAVAQVLRRQPSAAVFAMIAASLGISIGLIDTVHSPSRGRLVALGFGLAAAASAAMAVRLVRLRAWDRTLADAHRAPAHQEPVAPSAATGTHPVAEAVADDVASGTTASQPSSGIRLR